jgi:hypothetical protein
VVISQTQLSKSMKLLFFMTPVRKIWIIFKSLFFLLVCFTLFGFHFIKQEISQGWILDSNVELELHDLFQSFHDLWYVIYLLAMIVYLLSHWKNFFEGFSNFICVVWKRKLQWKVLVAQLIYSTSSSSFLHHKYDIKVDKSFQSLTTLNFNCTKMQWQECQVE